MRPKRARRPDDENAVREKALELLEYRSHAAKELSRKLFLRGYDAAAIRSVVAGLLEAGLLDDQKFAEEYAGGRLSMRPQGARLLVSKLMARGVVKKTAEAAVEKALEGRDEVELAVSSARGYLKRYGGGPLDAGRARNLQAYLARRGFDFDTISAAVRAVGAAEEEP